MLQFRIVRVFTVIAVAAISLSWYLDRTSLCRRLQVQGKPIELYGEKHSLYTPSDFIETDVITLKDRLSQADSRFKIDDPVGSETFDHLLRLLEHNSSKYKLEAAEVLAISLEDRAFNKWFNSDDNCAYQLRVSDMATILLKDGNPALRSAAALILANCRYRWKILSTIRERFGNDDDEKVLKCLAWAHWKIIHSDTLFNCDG